MRFLLYIIIVITIISCSKNSKSTSPEESTSEVDTTVGEDPGTEPLQALQSVEDIQKEFAYITSKIETGSMDSTSFDYNCYNEKSGTVTYFSEKGQLRLIKHAYSEYSHYSATDQYFVKDNALFFVFYDGVSWSFEGQNETRDDITEKRFYIIDNEPVKCLEKEFTVRSSATNNPQSSTVPNKEVECTTLEPILEKYELLVTHQSQKEDITCLED